MTHPIRNRSHLLVGCGSAALALALTMTPQRVAAQAFQAEGSIVFGAAEINNVDTTTDRVDVFSPTVVIDWDPFEDAGGNALNFLPTGTTGIFESTNFQNFAVLNRILPSTNGNIAVIDGSVISRFQDANGAFTTSGFVAFYSPTGILIGNNATFDVGRLLLTTLDTSPASFNNFATQGGNLSLAGATGSTARIQINPGAQISALAENSFFAVVAADVQMLGTARINGSHAYVAGEVVNLSFSNGLFNISIPVGTAAAGEVVTLDGNVGGPSSMGAGDNHILYAVARASVDPISMLFSGNLGFDPAQSAGIVNGEIILAANYNVFGRSVDTGSITQGINAVFRDESATSDVRADIVLEDFAAGSSVLAIGTGQTIARTVAGDSSVAGNLLLVGRNEAVIDAASGGGFTIAGDVLIDARDYGVVSSSLQTLDAINAAGGNARILTRGGSTLTIDGNALVTAEAFGGADDLNRIAGSALGGLAEISADGGSVSIGGTTEVLASAFGTNLTAILSGAQARGGTARVMVSGGGSATIAQNLLIAADGIGAEGDMFIPSTASATFGGSAMLAITGTGTIGIDGDVSLSASAFARGVNAGPGGSLADAGEAAVLIDGAGTITIDGDLALDAIAFGGDNAGGAGGAAFGGAARAITRTGNGLITVNGAFSASASAQGGDGTSGGDAFGGIAGANAVTGTIALAQLALADSSALGGSATIGFGGVGGLARGGNAFFQADGAANLLARLTIGGDAEVRATGTGGDGGSSDGSAIAAGRGGDGVGGDFAIPNQADPNFRSGAFLLAGGDYGTISVGGNATINASGFGGNGGDARGALTGGRGGDGIGGLAQAGLALLGGPGTVGGGSATFGFLNVDARGDGGFGGFTGTSDAPIGAGGFGQGGNALLTVRAGTVTAGLVELDATGSGRAGSIGGNGTGGFAGLLGGSGGVANLTRLDAFARGIGGEGTLTVSGNGQGGEAFIEGDGIAVTITGDVRLDASGGSVFSENADGGDGTGGRAYVAITDPALPGTITIGGHSFLNANGTGAGAFAAFAAGDGRGGEAFVDAQGGSVITFGSAQVSAAGRGGDADGSDGGDGIGGIADLRSTGTGSRIIIQRNIPIPFSATLGGSGILTADGIGGNAFGGSGVGGDGRGGQISVLARAGGSIALPLDPNGDPDTVGDIQLTARGIGGGSSVDGGRGGGATGGIALIEADGTGSSIVMGRTEFTVFAEGGSSLEPTSGITGGDAFGGTRLIRVLNGGAATLELPFGASGGRGGDGSGTGNGGDAFGGRTQVELNNGTLNIVGVLRLNDESQGGDGNRGGDAFSNGEGGIITFGATNSTITFAPDAAGQAGIALGGTIGGGEGATAGGSAQGPLVTFALTNTDLSGGFLRINPRAEGGSVFGSSGVGGNATAGATTINIIDSALNLVGENLITNFAESGDGGSEVGSASGAASSGAIIMTLTNSALTVAAGQFGTGILRLRSEARSGNGPVIGSATSGRAELTLVGSSLTADQLLVEAVGIADRGPGGAARGGDAVIQTRGASQVTADLIQISANAVTSVEGTSQGGTASLFVEQGSTASITAGELRVEANGSGADAARQANGAGQFRVEVVSGSINAQDLFASALGNVINGNPSPSTLVANGGSINVIGNLNADLLGNLMIQTGQGGRIGGMTGTAASGEIRIFTRGNIDIAGDNDAAIGLGGDTINLAARDIDITSGARIGANRVFIESLNTAATAILGGTAEGDGFTLTAAELARVNAREFGIGVPNLNGSNDPNLPDLLVRDLTLAGTGANGLATVRIFAGSDIANGDIRFEGTLTYANAGANDLLEIDARRIEIVTPGGIRITDASGAPGGNLVLRADNIWVADAATITQLQGDRNFAGRDALLATAAAGSDDPLGYLRAGGVAFTVRESLLVRNTGVMFEGGGILIGNGVLSIASSGGGQSGSGPQLDVIAYGRRQTAPGTFATGEVFFNEVNFNRASPGTAAYLDASAFNDCVINTGICPQPPSPEPDDAAPPAINNPTVFQDPINIGDTPPSAEGEEEERFGIDFPQQPETPLISENPLLDDPVTSGSDASIYGTTSIPPVGSK